jgi:Right handed beta helix region
MFTVKRLLLLITALATPACAFAQANVIENQSAILYVDATSGSDSNPGTQAKPFLTIGKAVSKAKTNNVSGIGTKVLINSGIYREFVDINATYKQTSATITIQATQPGTAIVAGSDVFTGWSRGTSNPSTYTHSWTPNFGLCKNPNGWPTTYAPITLRREMVFVNGMPLSQVISPSLMQAGTFYVDEAANKLTIWPSSSVNMSTAVVEVATRPETFSISGRTNMAVRGLVFEHAANCPNNNSASVNGSTNILVDAVQANWNNWGGLDVTSSKLVTVRNSIANHNGGVGFGGYHSSNTLYDSNESDYNNWRGAMGAYYDWAMGGTKLFSMHTSTVNNLHAYRNQAQGLWFDTDNKNIVASNNTLVENIGPNLQVEVNEGPIALTGSTLCSGGVGMNLINSENVTVTGNTFDNNGATNKYQAQIYMAGKSGGRALRDWETGQQYNLYNKNLSLHNNTFQDAAPGQYLIGTYLSGSDWSTFQTTLSSNNNTWYDPTSTKKFLIPNGKLVDLAGWQSNSTEDMGSAWATTMAQQPTSCLAPSPSFPDFSIITDNHTYTMSSGKTTINLLVHSYAYDVVTVSVAGLPAGVTATHSQGSLADGADVVTLTASHSAMNQTVLATVIASRGSRVHMASVYVHVVPGK